MVMQKHYYPAANKPPRILTALVSMAGSACQFINIVCQSHGQVFYDQEVIH
jgi:hypothetical protein